MHDAMNIIYSSKCRHTAHTVKILIDARAFIIFMVDAEVGSGRLLEASVLE